MKNKLITIKQRLLQAVIFAVAIPQIFGFSFLTFSAPLVARAAGIPQIISYQGRLTDSSGVLLGTASGTNYFFKFSIYDAVSGGTKLWPTSAPASTSASVVSGVFNVKIGDTGSGYPDALDFNFEDDEEVYLQVEVASTSAGTYEAIAPRQRITAAGYAINSKTLRGFAPSQVASGSNVPVLSGGNLTLGGTNPQINATSTNTLIIQGGAGTGDLALVTNGGKVGIGTAAPSSTLHVIGTATISATTTILGKLVDASGNAYVTSTTAGQGSVTTSTAVSVGYFPFWGSTSALTGTSTLFASSSRIGLGTVSPSSTLHIIGDVTISATTTIQGKLVDAAGNAYVTSTGAGSITTSTAVTAGYFPFWGSTSALTGTSTIFASSSRVGIGTISPSSTLHIIGTLQTSATSTFEGAIVIGGDTITDFVGTGLTMSGTNLTTTLGVNITAAELADVDFGDFTVSSGVATLDTGVVDGNELASTAVSAGSYGTASTVVIFTVDADGRLTAASTSSIAIAASQVTGTALTAANNLSELTSTSSARTNLGLGDSATLASSTWLKVANNGSDITSTSTFRTNLGLGTASLQNIGAFLQVANNGSDITSTSTFRSNLGLGDIATLPSSTFAKVANNLSDITSTSTARTNLGLGDIATLASSTFLKVANNFSDLNNTSTARTNLGLGDSATLASSTWLKVTNNFSDLNNTSTARTNLGLGDSAILASSTFLKTANNGSDINNTSTFRTNLGLGDSATLASSTFLKVANNLSDLNNTSTARTNIGFSGGNKITISATGTIGLTTSSISQFTNDSGYVTSTGSGTVGTSTAVTTGYFPFWGSTSGLTGTSTIFASSTRIGIGTISPSSTLHVIGDTSVTGIITSGSYGVINGVYIGYQNSQSLGNNIYGQSLMFSGANVLLSNALDSKVGIGSIAAPVSTLHVVSGASSSITSIFQTTSTQTVDLTQWRSSSSAVMSVVDSTGRFGIGTASPSSTLHVVGDAIITATTTVRGRLVDAAGNSYVTSTGAGSITTSTAVTAGYFPFWGSTSALTGTSTIFASSSRIGIGTISPSTTLHVIGTFQTTATSTFLGNVGIGTTTPQGAAHIFGGSSAATGYGADYTDLIVEDDDHAGITIFAPDNKFNRLVFGNPSDVFAGSFTWDYANLLMQFNTANSGAGISFGTADEVEAIRITSAQRVGIGTSAPSSSLHVRSLATSTITQIFQATSTQTVDLTQWRSSSSAVLSVVDSTGRFGIGTAAPSSTLHVVGDATITGGVYTTLIQNSAGDLNIRSDSAGSKIMFGFPNDGHIAMDWGNSALRLPSDYQYKWSINNGNPPSATADLGLARNAAGVLRVSDGTTGLGGLVASSTIIGANNTPSSTLHVIGTATISATTTIQGKLVDAAGNAYVTSTSAGSGTVSTSTAVTAGYFPFWGSGSALTGTSTIFSSSSLIGIGTVSPSTTLHVVGTFRASATSTFLGNVGIGTTSPATLFSVATSSNIFNVTSEGRVGIGTSSPAVALEVIGSIRGNQSGAIRIDSGNGYIDVGAINTGFAHITTDRPTFYFNNSLTVDGGLFKAYAGNTTLQSTAGGDVILSADSTNRLHVIGSSGLVGIGTSTPSAALHIISPATSSITQIIQATSTQTVDLTQWRSSSSAVLSVVDSTGRFGIGTASPSSTLHVAGDARVNGTLYNDYLLSRTGDLSIRAATYSNSIGFGVPNDNRIIIDFTNAAMRFDPAYQIQFYPNTGTPPSGTPDIGIARNSTSTLRITDGSTGLGVLMASTTILGSTSTPSSTLHVIGTATISATTTIQGKLVDAAGNAYVTSTTAGSGTVSTSTAVTAGYFPFWGSTSGLTGTSTIYSSGTGASARIGIGTTEPSSTLHVVGNSQNVFRVVNSIGSLLMNIEDGGNVGIGTSTAEAALHIKTTGATESLRLQNTGFYTTINQVSNGNFQITTSNTADKVYIGPGGDYTFILGAAATGAWIGTGLGVGSGFSELTGPTNGLAVQGFTGIGTVAPSSTLHLVGTNTSTISIMNTATSSRRFDLRIGGIAGATGTLDIYDFTSSTSRLAIAPGGNISIGSSTPASSTLHVFGTFQTTATSTLLGKTIIGAVNTPSTTLHVVGDFSVTATSTFYGATIVDNLTTGPMVFDADSGIISWIDMSVSTAVATNTVESYTAQIDGNPMITVYAEANGSGGTNNRRVGIATTVPSSTLHVVGGFEVSSGSTKLVYVSSSTGFVGIGTATPSTTLHVVGTFRTTATSTFLGNVGVGTTSPSTLFAVATSSNIFNVLSSGNVGIGTSTPSALLTVVGNSAERFSVTNSGTTRVLFAGDGDNFQINGVDGTWLYAGWSVGAGFGLGAKLTTISGSAIHLNGNTGIGTATPSSTLHLVGTNTSTISIMNTTNSSRRFDLRIGGIASATGTFDIYDFTSSTSRLAIAPGGNISIGSSTPASSTLHVFGDFQVTGTSTLSGQTTIDNLSLGASTFAADSGQITWIDMLVSTAVATNTVESYTANIDGNPMITVYSEANGSGGTNNRRVGIATIVPSSTLHVVGANSSTVSIASTVTGGRRYDFRVGGVAGATSTFDLYDFNSSTSRLAIAAGGNVSIGSSTAASSTLHVFGDLRVTTTSSFLGNVGVGTSSPTTPLYVIGTGTFVGSSDNQIQITGNHILHTYQGAPRFSIYSNAAENIPLGGMLGSDTDAGVLMTANGANQKSYISGGNNLYFYTGSTTSTPRMMIGSTGNISIGSSTAASSTLHVFGTFQTTATSTLLGKTIIGAVNTPSSTLHVVGDFTVTGTSTLQGLTSIENLSLGATTFEADAGILTWVDMPVTASSSAGTKEAYIAQIDGNPMLTVYSESDGAGGTQNRRVGIATAVPSSTLHVAGGFEVSSGTSKFLYVSSTTGFVSIGTSTPSALFTIATSSQILTVSSTGLMSFGGATSTSVALLRSGTQLQVRKGDNSGPGTFRAGQQLDVTDTADNLVFYIDGPQGGDLRMNQSTDFIWSSSGFADGSGGGSLDTRLRRLSAGTLILDNNAGAGGSFRVLGDIAIGISFASSTLHVASPATSTITQIIQATSTQTVDLTQWRSSSSAVLAVVNSTGKFGIGTAAPSSTLHVVGDFTVTATTTFQGPTTIDNLYVGASTFGNDAGQVTWIDMPVSTAVATNTVESYTANIDGTPLLTVYAEANGSGGIQNQGVLIATSTRSTTSSLFYIATSTSILQVRASGGIVVGNPTSDDKGYGTINANGVYDDNTLLTDWVFDAYYGTMNASDTELHANYKMMTIDEMMAYNEEHRHLPTISGRDEWKAKGGFSLGSLVSQLWETAETNSLYIGELNSRLKTLETIAGGSLQGSGNMFGPDEKIIVRAARFGEDALGQAEILVGATKVDIVFDEPYEYEPIVTITPTTLANIRYAVTNTTLTGFTIEINNEQEEVVGFNWHAFESAPDAKLTVSDGTSRLVNIVVVETPEEETPPTEEPQPEPEGEVAGESTETGEEEPPAEPPPVEEPAPEPTPDPDSTGSPQAEPAPEEAPPAPEPAP